MDSFSTQLSSNMYNLQPDGRQNQQEPTLVLHAPVFRPVASKNRGKFISGASVTILIMFILLLRSSAGPFLNPKVSGLF